MKTSDFDYELPPELIAQTPLEPRDHSRLMVLDRARGSLEHRHFYDIVDYLKSGDALLLNDSRVIPARLRGWPASGGPVAGPVELLLLHRTGEKLWQCLGRPARKLKPGTRLSLGNGDAGSAIVQAEIVDSGDNGTRLVRFSDETLLDKVGQVPLPPYIHTPLKDAERYQTVYARNQGSAAAPTAGLHFTPELLNRIQGKGVDLVFTTLHIGLDTFQPVREADPRCHHIHREYGCLSPQAAAALNRAKAEGRRIIAVGTTSVRLVEQAALRQAQDIALSGDGAGIGPFQGWASLFILPGYRFRAVDALITNFHLPRSSLLLLVSAFAGKELIGRAYREAIGERYRFYSFGDAMLIF